MDSFTCFTYFDSDKRHLIEKAVGFLDSEVFDDWHTKPEFKIEKIHDGIDEDITLTINYAPVQSVEVDDVTVTVNGHTAMDLARAFINGFIKGQSCGEIT